MRESLLVIIVFHLVYQLGLVEREIGEVVRGLFTNTGGSKPTTRKTDGESDSREKLSKKEITEDDVCPICQEDLFEQTQPTTYCKYGCGNSVHIKCMKVWAEHQKSSGETIIKCPLCRVDFGPFETIKSDYLRSVKNKQRYDVHIGAVCAHCGVSPITGKCFRCTICSNYQLCKDCFSLNPHPQHTFHFRQKPNQRWRPASKFEAIPSAVANNLERREITEQDYNLLLQLDGSSVSQCSVPGHVLNSFPTETLADDNHRLIVNANEQCGVCLCSYRSSQVVRRLPCNHEFHRVCIDSWLSRDHNVCPIDGQTVYSDVVRTPPNRGMNRATQNPRQRNLPVKKTSLSTLSKRQRTSHNREFTIPQDFSLYGSSLRQRYLYIQNSCAIKVAAQY
ncbi:E3 ubiquitin- ligase ZSWIM2-like [Paramuricea clavata]|uniref:E3 ubiquitin- ligase ZSWIM2-like n=1 Tax=Paramuricea clavata TaxID=317549 RepID=A0A7D9EQC4_PARCT|nr:E3 ubiquitin- ligase ZSWIM2-like [Paramuricea clavata]